MAKVTPFYIRKDCEPGLVYTTTFPARAEATPSNQGHCFYSQTEEYSHYVK